MGIMRTFIATLVIGTAAILHAPSAGADTVTETLLAEMAAAGLAHRGDAPTTERAAQAVCELMDAGMSPMDTVLAVQTTNPGFSLDHAARFAAIAARLYCPNHY